MKRWARTWAMAAMVAAAMLFAVAPRAKAQDSGISGTLSDLEGKPWPNYTVSLESEQGAKTDTKTDASGKYTFSGLKTGTYKIYVMLPYQKDPYLAGQVKVASGQNVPADLNLLELVAKKNPEYAAAVKKQAEEGKKASGMKQHFDAGDVALAASRQAKADYTQAKADQRDALKQQEKENAEKAVTEFEAAKAAAPEKDQNLPLIYSRLGDAYEASGRSDDAIAAYKSAIEIKPAANFYMNLGGVQGRAGKTEDATASFQKAAELDPANAAQAWRNYGIIMYKANKTQEAIEPLKKSTELDPKNAQAWYLLATCMMADPSIYKQTASSIEVNPKPGTVEAFQKAIDLDPNGPWGKEAKAGLDQLKGMMGGISTKVNEKKKKP
ncbi:MAG TPA: tetratricopeptide repeat protein [Candidatus Dormibacteraeota bacterium]|nr:tetratricopeptide repeat protein [Candidatus Dormibacteraeota bacterium]